MSPVRYYGANVQIVLGAVVVSTCAVLAWNWLKTKRISCVPKLWKPVGTVSNLFLYPLKSGRRVNLQSGECTISGLKKIKEDGKYQIGDRTLIVYKYPTLESRTARTNPKIVLVEVALDDHDCFVITAPNMEPLRIDIYKVLNNATGDRREEILTLSVAERFLVVDCGEEAAVWVSKSVGENGSTDLRLGMHDGRYRRAVSRRVNEYIQLYPNITISSLGVYSDFSSFMLMNQASLNDCLTRLPNSNVTVNNFRPNILIQDDNLAPFDEDNWEWVKIGDVIFRYSKPCTRCILTTVDPETGIRDTTMEPLKTLRSYRLNKDEAKQNLEKGSPVMGIHLQLIAAGIINVGDVYPRYHFLYRAEGYLRATEPHTNPSQKTIPLNTSSHKRKLFNIISTMNLAPKRRPTKRSIELEINNNQPPIRNDGFGYEVWT